MSKTIATLALTAFIGTFANAGFTATDANADVRKHCVKNGKVISSTACDTLVRKKNSTIPTTTHVPTRKFNFVPNTDFSTERGGGGEGGGQR